MLPSLFDTYMHSGNKTAHRNQLINALQSANALSTSTHATGSELALTPSKTSLTPLKKADYPIVKHWTRIHGNNSQVAYIKVVDAGSPSGDEGPPPATKSKKRDHVCAFLEKEDGSLISPRERESLYSAARGFWNVNVKGDSPPENWSSAGETLRNLFRHKLETNFFYLRLCEDHWKVDELWKKNYHSWRTSYLHRLKKRKLESTEANSDKNSDSLTSDKDSLHDNEAGAPKPKKARGGIENEQIAKVTKHCSHFSSTLTNG